MLDLKTLTAKSPDAAVDMPLRSPTDGEIIPGVIIKVLGPDSTAAKKIQHTIGNKRLKQVAKSGGRLNLDMEQAETDNLERVVACVTGWEGVALGEPLDFSPDNARRLFKEAPWVMEQVRDFVTDRANFLGN